MRDTERWVAYQIQDAGIAWVIAQLIERINELEEKASLRSAAEEMRAGLSAETQAGTQPSLKGRE